MGSNSNIGRHAWVSVKLSTALALYKGRGKFRHGAADKGTQTDPLNAPSVIALPEDYDFSFA